jgi:hypothetical protein
LLAHFAVLADQTTFLNNLVDRIAGWSDIREQLSRETVAFDLNM